MSLDVFLKRSIRKLKKFNLPNLVEEIKNNTDFEALIAIFVIVLVLGLIIFLVISATKQRSQNVDTSPRIEVYNKGNNIYYNSSWVITNFPPE